MNMTICIFAYESKYFQMAILNEISDVNMNDFTKVSSMKL